MKVGELKKFLDKIPNKYECIISTDLLLTDSDKLKLVTYDKKNKRVVFSLMPF